MNQLFKAFIILGSELLWIYYLIAAYTVVEWQSAHFVNSFWWVIACVIGYVLNRMLIGRINYIPLIILNGIVLIFILIQNWRLIATEQSIIFGIIISIVIIFAYIRSGQLVFKEPTRMQMLLHFEVNIVIYAFFAFVFTNNQVFHGVFLLAIFLTLFDMVLTLQNHEKEENENEVEIHRVGKSGWFTAVIGLLLASVVLASFLLFLPSIRQLLQSMAQTGFNGIVWLYNQATTFLIWLFSFFPDSQQAPMEGMESEGFIPGEEVPEETLLSIPTGLLIAIGIVIGLGVLILIIVLTSRFLKQWKPPKLDKAERVFTFKDSWWKQLMHSLSTFLKVPQQKWRVKFSLYYQKPVYWYYYKLQCWGKKNKLAQRPTETSKEYIEKITAMLQKQEGLSNSEKEFIITGLQKMNDDYQATYYGNHPVTPTEDYRVLLQQLNHIKLNKNSLQSDKPDRLKRLIPKKN